MARLAFGYHLQRKNYSHSSDNCYNDRICRKYNQDGTMQVARKSKPVDLMAFAAALQKRHEAATTVESRKEKGQVFTPVGVCRYMAGLFTRIPDRGRLLDAGAGIGSLAAAFCERRTDDAPSPSA